MLGKELRQIVREPTSVRQPAAFLRPVAAVLALALGASGCAPEKRAIGPSPPLSPPARAVDKRLATYETNFYEQAEGGRMYRWFGCDQCHKDPSPPGVLNLADAMWRYGGTTPAIYASIAAGRPGGMPAYGGQVAPQQILQISGYIGGLRKLKAAVRRRQSMAQLGEPSGREWSGALR